MGVDALQRTDELIVKSLNVGNDASRNLNVLLAGLERRRLLVIVPLLRVLNNDVILVLLENLQKGRELLLSSLPVVQRHSAGATRAQVESSGNEGEEDSDLLVRGSGNLAELLHNLDLLGSVGVLLSTRLEDASEVLEDALRGVLESSAALSDGRETAIVDLLVDGLNLEAGDLLGLGSRLLLLLGRLHVAILVLSVGIDLGLIFLVGLLDLLLDGVQCSGLGGVHLLGGDFLLSQGLVHEFLEFGHDSDEGLGCSAAILHLGDLSCKLVEFFNVSSVRLIHPKLYIYDKTYRLR